MTLRDEIADIIEQDNNSIAGGGTRTWCIQKANSILALLKPRFEEITKWNNKVADLLFANPNISNDDFRAPIDNIFNICNLDKPANSKVSKWEARYKRALEIACTTIFVENFNDPGKMKTTPFFEEAKYRACLEQAQKEHP